MKMEIVEALKNKYFFILGYGKDPFNQTILYFHYNLKDDTFSTAEDNEDPILDQHEIINDSVRFSKWTITKDGDNYKILIHDDQTLHNLIMDFEIELVC